MPTRTEWKRLEAYAKKHPEDEEFLQNLAAYKALLDDNPLQDFRPLYIEQSCFLGSKTKIKLFAGGNRAGKTTISIVDDLIQAVDESCLPQDLKEFKYWQPPFRCRIVCPAFGAPMQAVFETIRRWVPKHQLRGGNWEKGFDKANRVLSFANGSFFQFLTAEQDVDKHSSAELDRVHFDEEPPGDKGRQLFQENMVRLIDRKGQVLISMTPLFGMSWVHDEIVEKRGEPHITVIHADMEQNPTLDKDEIKLALSSLTKEEIQARKEGKFIHFEGLVYPQFKHDVHVVDGPTRDMLKTQDVVVAIDPGLDRTAVLWVAFDNDNCAVAFDELYLPDHTVEMVAVEIKRKNKPWELTDPYYVIDPSSRNRTLTNAEQVEGEFQRQGIFAAPAQNSVEAGIFQVKRRLETRPAPSLLISKACGYLIWEFSRYRYDHKSKSGKVEIIKRDDHLLDCLRYCCLDRAWGTTDWTTPIPRPRRWTPEYEPPWDGERIQQTELPMGAMS